MVIRPEELEKSVQHESSGKLAEFVKRIDDELQKQALSDGMDTFVCSVSTDGQPKFIIDKAIQQLRRSGWEAKTIYSQRDGGYLQIKKATHESF